MRRSACAAVVLAVGAVLAAVAGCGEGDGEQAPQSSNVKVIPTLGDSITAGSPLWDPDPAVRAGIPQADERSQFQYWGEREDSDVEGEYRNCGVFGERTDEIAQRLDECAEGADAIIIQGGINDIAQGRPVEDAADDLRSMVVRAKELGVLVILTDVLPWNNGHPGADEPIRELNAAIRRIGREEEVAVLGFHDTLEDPDEPGTMKAEWTIDGDHPSIEGYRLLGQSAGLVGPIGRE